MKTKWFVLLLVIIVSLTIVPSAAAQGVQPPGWPDCTKENIGHILTDVKMYVCSPDGWVELQQVNTQTPESPNSEIDGWKVMTLFFGAVVFLLGLVGSMKYGLQILGGGALIIVCFLALSRIAPDAPWGLLGVVIAACLGDILGLILFRR